MVNKSASAQKLNVSLKSTDDSTGPPVTFPECNFIINSELCSSLITMIGRCPACIGSINIEHLISEKMGLAEFFSIYCNDCDWNQKFCPSKECSRDSSSSGRNSFDLNKRALIAFRENGHGYAAMTTFCWCMNMSPPIAQTTFDDLNSDLHNAYVQTAQESMTKAAKTVYNNLANINTNTNSNCSQNAKVSGDGAWQKRGYSSLNGVVTLISDGKCIDTLKFYQRTVSSVNNGSIERSLLSILIGKRSISVLLIILAVQELWKL